MTEACLFDAGGQYRLESDVCRRQPTTFFGQHSSDGRADQGHLGWHRRGNDGLADSVPDQNIGVGCRSSAAVHIEAVRKGNWGSETGSGTRCGDANFKGYFVSASEHSELASLDLHHQGMEPPGPLGTRQILCVEANHHWRK